LISSGKLRGDKVLYPEGVWGCVWYPLFDEDGKDDTSPGLCFNFAFEDIDDLINILQQMKTAEPEVYEDAE